MQTGKTIKEQSGVLGRIAALYVKYKGIISFLWAFILSDACLMGSIRPFGLCYAMTLPEETRLWGCMGAFAGSMAISGGGEGMVYCAAGMIALAVDVFLLSGSRSREIYLPVMLAALVAFIKLPFALFGGVPQLLLLILEGAVTLLACYCLMLPKDGHENVPGYVMRMLAASAFAGLRIFSVMSPSLAAVSLMTMNEAYYRGSRGAPLGMLMGAVMDMSIGQAPFFTAALGIAGALSACTRRRGRAVFALSFLGSMISVMIWGMADSRAVLGLFAAFAAAIVFLLLPEKEYENTAPVGALHTESDIFQQSSSLSLRLRELGRAISSISRSIAAEEQGCGGDISGIFDRAAADVCSSCRMSRRCWMDDYVSTFDSMNALIPILRRDGHIDNEDIGGSLRDGCIKKGDLCAAINHEYISYLRRKAAASRRKAEDEVLRRQYEGLGAAARGLSASTRDDYVRKPLLQKQISAVLFAYRRDLTAEVYSQGGRLNMRIGLFERCEPWIDEQSFLNSIALAVGRRFHPGEVIEGRKGDILLFRECENYVVSVSSAVKKREGEEVCGDTNINFRTDDGRMIVMLSDGMGTGRRAAELSKNAVGLVASFVRCGCSLADSAGAVIPFLQSRCRSSGFATLDLLEIDLFTGAAVMIKCGAADSWLVRGKEVETICCRALPPGVDDGSGEISANLMLHDGCRIVMVSDGVEIADPAVLTRADLRAGELIGSGNVSDDMTAVVIDIKAADKTAL